MSHGRVAFVIVLLAACTLVTETRAQDEVCIPELFRLVNLDLYRILCVCRATDPERLIGRAAYSAPIPADDTEGSASAVLRCFERNVNRLEESCRDGKYQLFEEQATRVLNTCLDERLTAAEQELDGEFEFETSTCTFDFTQRLGDENFGFSVCICDQQEGFRVLLAYEYPLPDDTELANQQWIELNQCLSQPSITRRLQRLCDRFSPSFISTSEDILDKCASDL